MTTSSDGEYDNKLRAWSLVTEDHLSVRQAASVMGVSRSSVSRWVREVESVQDFIDLLDVAEVRVGQAVRCERYIRLLEHRIEKEGRPAEQIVPHLLNVEKFVADLVGTRMPARLQVDHTGAGGPSGVDPKFVEAVRQAKQFTAVERREIEDRGGDG